MGQKIKGDENSLENSSALGVNIPTFDVAPAY